jgi:hypothetical protein
MACSGCHGRYEHTARGIDVTYADLGLIDAGTDRAYNDLMRRLAPIVERTSRTRAFYGEDAPAYVPLTARGYTPPVLVGLWASAPYLHNGSVPALADMLTPPAERPEIWGRSVARPSAYDFDRAGIDAERIDGSALEARRRAAAGQAPDAPASVEYRRFYDARRPGRSSQGHPFGTDLAPGEKQALIDFLQSLAPMDGRTEVRIVR